jgi:hypothetical protein
MVMNKREARNEFKSRRTPKGIFAIRCTAAEEVWVGASDHLNSARNGIWFLLRNGLHPNKRLQATWNTHGEEAFDYEVLENVDEDVSPLLLGDLLRERLKHWETELGASIV